MALDTAPGGAIRNTFAILGNVCPKLRRFDRQSDNASLHEVDFSADLPRTMRDIQRRKLNWCVIGDASNAILPPFFPVVVLRDTNTSIEIDGITTRLCQMVLDTAPTIRLLHDVDFASDLPRTCGH